MVIHSAVVRDAFDAVLVDHPSENEAIAETSPDRVFGHERPAPLVAAVFKKGLERGVIGFDGLGGGSGKKVGM